MKNKYTFSYACEFLTLLFLMCFCFSQVFFLQGYIPKNILIVFWGLTILAFALRILSFGLHGYNRTYIDEFYMVYHEHKIINFVLQVIATIIIGVVIRIM